ncbi:B12-binding domain-containing radical SAM protein [Streptomyces monomycini]|uniref:B12-binding domain-containing radical SAM protein n=1 Tax=Streptomyces monomycini TaxID=371720 RepID=UPI001EE9C1A7|nr:radical SAM protein [Streptomyces monomycini]
MMARRAPASPRPDTRPAAPGTSADRAVPAQAAPAAEHSETPHGPSANTTPDQPRTHPHRREVPHALSSGPASVLDEEIANLHETRLTAPYPRKISGGLLRMVFMLPFGHAFSLMCNGPMALYDLVNRSPNIPAVAERALQYDCLVREGNRLSTPDGVPYRTIESPRPVREADIVGISMINAGDLHSVLRLLDLAGVPRRSRDRVPGRHPLVIGGNQGLADPEPLADYLDVVAIGEAEQSLAELLHLVHRAKAAHPAAGTPPARAALLQDLARVPGLYVPALYEPHFAPGGGVQALGPRSVRVPARVHAQYLGVGELRDAHFVYPITDGTAAGMHPVIGCRHTCSFCNLGIPPFRQAPLPLLLAYIDRLEELQVPTVIISAPTFTQYRHRQQLLERLRAYAHRAAAAGRQVTTIIGSIRADEISADYLDAVTELGDFGHLFTELHVAKARGVITIAPEWASPDLVALYGKTQTPARIHRALELCRANGNINTVMLYFILGAPGERPADRLAIADYAVDVRRRLGATDTNVIIKLHQFMPKPGTPTQRLAMMDPDVVHAYGDQVRDRVRALAGDTDFAAHYRVEQFATGRMHLEVVCSRGDRRVGHVLEDLYDAGTDLAELTKDQLVEALDRHGLDYDRHLRHMDDPVLPWHVLNHVNRTAEDQLATALAAREAAQ